MQLLNCKNINALILGILFCTVIPAQESESRNDSIADTQILLPLPLDIKTTQNSADTDTVNNSTQEITGIVVEGVLIDSAGGGPPHDDSLFIQLDSIKGSIDSAGGFRFVISPRQYYLISVFSAEYSTVKKTVTCTDGKRNYFLTIVLDKKNESEKVIEKRHIDTAYVPWTISGTIIDSRFDLAIESDSTVMLFDKDTITVSENGNFYVKTHVSGTHTFYVSIPGYHQVSQSITLNEQDKQLYITIPTTILSKRITRREITVSAKTLPVHRSASVAKVSLSRKELQRTSATLNDPVRVLQTLPGVASESDASARPIVRGGDVLESRVFLDGLTLIQPYHFGGARSTFNQQSIKELTLYKSGFPSEFHNAQSAIIEAESRIPSEEKTSFDLDLNFLQYSAYLGIPLFKGKAGLNLSSQGSYTDAVSKLIMKMGSGAGNKEMDNTSKLINLPDYQDFSAGLSIEPNSNFKIYINEILNTDRVRFCSGDSSYDETGKAHSQVDTILNYKSKYNLLYGKAQYIPSQNSIFTLTAGWQKRWWDLNFPEVKDWFDTSIYDVDLDQYNANLGWQYSGLKNHVLKTGVQLDYTTADYHVYMVRYIHEIIENGSTNFIDFWGPVNGDSSLTISTDEDIFQMLMDRILVSYAGKENFYNAGYYLSDSWDMTADLHCDIGARLEYSNSDNVASFSPRLSMRYNIAPKHELIGSIGHYTQNNYSISAMALSKNLQPEKTWHCDAGLESKFLPWLTQKIDLYGKYYYDLISEIISPIGHLSIEDIQNYVNRDYDPDYLDTLSPEKLQSLYAEEALKLTAYRSYYTNDGRGYAYGFEYFLRFDPTDFWDGWISLSWGQSIRQRMPGWRLYPFPLDRPLLISINNYYRLPRKYEIGVKYRYMSGVPYTSVEHNGGMIKIGAFNDRRYAPYQRLDFRLSKGFSIKGAKGHIYTEIWNAMNAPNLFCLDSKTKIIQTFNSNLPTTVLFFGVDCTY